MTLEEAQAKITQLEGDLKAKETEIVGLKENAGKSLSEDDIKKLEQKSYNQGFDKAKNQFEAEKDGYLKKDDVDQMLKERDAKYKVKTELFKMGIKNPDKALKIIDDEDLETLGNSEFKSDDFVSKYSDVLVFGKGEEKVVPKIITKDNKTPDGNKVTVESYGDMSPSERAKMSPQDKLALLKD